MLKSLVSSTLYREALGVPQRIYGWEGQRWGARSGAGSRENGTPGAQVKARGRWGVWGELRELAARCACAQGKEQEHTSLRLPGRAVPPSPLHPPPGTAQRNGSAGLGKLISFGFQPEAPSPVISYACPLCQEVCFLNSIRAGQRPVSCSASVGRGSGMSQGQAPSAPELRVTAELGPARSPPAVGDGGSGS